MQIEPIINQLVGDDFITDSLVENIFVDFYFPSQGKAIIVMEEAHDHPDAYYPKSIDAAQLKSKGKEVLLLWIDNATHNTELTAKLKEFLQ
ncbi:hypothetical protein [Luteibaculum oceani]|uniref:Uncharacterized protein n=1 Tax=Luteibaculum oceani TaxID=1294296 RepID=A0A5C6USB2_9FLAO|nr:hypothetical protein [Luteibaculum oceani]TXC76213.1 hypothetical protein FRX97_10725 [Luteibaculum oceani]